MFSKDHLKKALALKEFDAIRAQNMMTPRPRESVRPPEKKGSPNQGAVMLLLYNKNHKLNILLVKRQDNLSYHPGQISFPGGKHEYRDFS